jgi:L-ascorbate metabolism protein UlaG (beta-lactamase superfamily)
MEQVKISYHGHACFMLEAQGYRTAIDPYRYTMIPGLPELKLRCNAAYCSHGHEDHNYVSALEICPGKAAPYTMEEYIVPHDDAGGIQRGMNTVRIFQFGGLRIVHLGDIGIFPEEELLEALKGVDCLLIPVGGYYTVDAAVAKQIVDAVKPRVCVPMHYRTDETGFDVIAHLSDFTKQYESVNYVDNAFVLTKDTPEQILVINYKP